MLVAGMLLEGCSTLREHSQSATSFTVDSTRYVETVRVDTLRIPGDTVQVSIPWYIFKTDTIVRWKSGRAEIVAESLGGQMKLRATCDSLEHLVSHYQTVIERYRTSKETSTTQSSKTTSGPSFWTRIKSSITGFVWGVSVSVVVYIAYRLIKKITPFKI